jgi:UDP-N-acetylglucosamine 2-epimerase (non-hydrolysing)
MISLLLGTRPEIIKMSPIIRECERAGCDYFILHTGQHYSYDMDKVFFEQLGIPAAKYNLDAGSGTHAEQTAKILHGVGEVLGKEKPDMVIVEGDTNTVLAGALAASKLHIRVGHVEAGLRSYDRRMPEEINRILTDHCSDLLFAPTERSRQTLLNEGIHKKNVFLTGNTIVDAVQQNMKLAGEAAVFDDLGVEAGGYALATVHRSENTDDPIRLARIIEGLRRVSEDLDLPVICPLHPRTKKKMDEFGLNADGIRLVGPMDYLSFLKLEGGAKLVLTDSGGVQEEACILRVPCVTLRDNTERPETVEAGSNMLAGSDPYRILECARIMAGKGCGAKNPFGDGRAGKKIVKIIKGDIDAN